MQSAIFLGPDKGIEIQDRPIPVPGPGEVLIRVHHCGLCGTDLSMTEASPFAFPDGSAIGHEFAGEVVELGPDCNRLAVGDRIAVMPVGACGACVPCRSDDPFRCVAAQIRMGGFSEFALVCEIAATKVPGSLSSADAALVEPMAASLRGTVRSGVSIGDKVLVIGAGSIGLGAIFWAKRLGAGKIVATARSAWRESMASAVGADAYLAGEVTPERLIDTFGTLPDIVIECSGAPQMIERSIEFVRPGGTVGVLSGCTHQVQFTSMLALMKEVSIQFSVGYRSADFRMTVDALSAGAGLAALLVTQRIALPGLAEAVEHQRQHKDQCKIMVEFPA